MNHSFCSQENSIPISSPYFAPCLALIIASYKFLFSSKFILKNVGNYHATQDLVRKQFIFCILSNWIYWNFYAFAFSAAVASHLTHRDSGVNTELTII